MPVTVLARPEQVGVTPGGYGAGLTGRVAATAYHGHDSVIRIDLDDLGLAIVARTGSDVAVGAEVSVTVEGPVVVWARTPPAAI